MPLDWLNTPVDVPISELIARKKRARTIDALRAQLQGRLAPGVQVRLQLADLLVQAGRQDEAIPVLLGLADEFASDGFVAKAIAILKRVEKVHGSHPDVASRLERLVQQQHKSGHRSLLCGDGLAILSKGRTIPAPSWRRTGPGRIDSRDPGLVTESLDDRLNTSGRAKTGNDRLRPSA